MTQHEFLEREEAALIELHALADEHPLWDGEADEVLEDLAFVQCSLMAMRIEAEAFS